MSAVRPAAPLTARGCPLAHIVWWSHLWWVLAAAVVGFIALVPIVGLLLWPEAFVYLTPGSINKGMYVFFLMPTVLLWNGEKKTSSILGEEP
jgi:hypothetical protein